MGGWIRCAVPLVTPVIRQCTRTRNVCFSFDLIPQLQIEPLNKTIGYEKQPTAFRALKPFINGGKRRMEISYSTYNCQTAIRGLIFFRSKCMAITETWLTDMVNFITDSDKLVAESQANTWVI